jgi:RecA/RadA recombinase
MDLMLGGGIAPAMTTFLGPEQSAKTTLAITMMAASVDQRVDMRVHWDAEGSTSSSIDYVANIFDTVGVKKATTDTVFGVRGKDGWEIPPMVFIKDDYEGRKFFDWFHGLQKKLPDKRYEDGRWWYVYDDAKDVMKVKAHIAKLGLTIDAKMTAKNPGIWVEAEDSRLQAIVLIDSWVSLVPPSMDEEEGDNSLAVQARFFSKELPRIKGALRAKRIALLGINQLRLNPMQRYGSPETEPGGQALRFWSDQRFRLFPNALSSAPYNPKPDPNMKDGRFESEPSVTGKGVDTYRYISVKTIKNKLSLPTASTWLRLWVSDGEGNARGYDPVFDLVHYLMQTGQATGKRSAIRLQIDGLEPASKALSWLEFKTMVLGDKEARREVFAKIGMRPVDLRKGCVNQLRSGRGKELFVEQVQAAAANKKSDDDADGDE